MTLYGLIRHLHRYSLSNLLSTLQFYVENIFLVIRNIRDSIREKNEKGDWRSTVWEVIHRIMFVPSLIWYFKFFFFNFSHFKSWRPFIHSSLFMIQMFSIPINWCYKFVNTNRKNILSKKEIKKDRKWRKEKKRWKVLELSHHILVQSKFKSLNTFKECIWWISNKKNCLSCHRHSVLKMVTDLYRTCGWLASVYTLHCVYDCRQISLRGTNADVFCVLHFWTFIVFRHKGNIEEKSWTKASKRQSEDFKVNEKICKKKNPWLVHLYTIYIIHIFQSFPILKWLWVRNLVNKIDETKRKEKKKLKSQDNHSLCWG